KTDDHVCGDGDFFSCFSNSPHERTIFVGGVRAMHRFQNAVRAGLDRKMNVFRQLRQFSQRSQQIVPKSDRVRRSETQTLESIDGVDGFEQLDEWALAIHGGELV